MAQNIHIVRISSLFCIMIVVLMPAISLAQFVLPECSIDSECPDFGVYFCLNVHCNNGTCINTSHACALETPFCDEVNDQCVECLVDSDCDTLASEEAIFRTETAQAYLNVQESIVPLTSSFCDVGSLLELSDNDQYGITNLYDVIPVNVTISIVMKCSSQTFTCYTYSNSTSLDIRYVNQSIEENTTHVSNIDSCYFNQTSPVCDEQENRCVQCLTTSDCLSMIEDGITATFPDDVDKLTDFCSPSIFCHVDSGTCLFTKTPALSPSINTVINANNKLSLIDLTNSSNGVHLTNTQLANLLSEAENFTHFFELLYLWNDNIQKTPCDFVDQRNREYSVPLLTCNTIPGMCSVIQCQSSGDCQDDDECNGEELCDTQDSVCIFPENSTCPLDKICDTGSNICQECLQDLECEPENPCDGIGVCIPDTNNDGRLKCDIITRCNSIVESCDPLTNITEVLSWYGYTDTEMPQIPSDRRLEINPEDDTYDLPPTGNSTTINGTGQSTVGNQRKSVSSDLSILTLQNNNTGGDLLPPNFDWRRIYCKSYYCENSTDCPVGTICKIYTTDTNSNKKCRKCTTDAECQDGMKCNGQERCHPEGTCRRAKRNVCEQYLLDDDGNETLTLENVTCLETSGLCIIKDKNDSNSSELLILIQDTKNTNTPKTVHSQAVVHIMDTNTTEAKPISTTLLATAIVIPLTAVIIVIIIITSWLSSYQRKVKRKKKSKGKKKYN